MENTDTNINAHVCNFDCFIGQVSYSEDGILGQFHYHMDGVTETIDDEGFIEERPNGWAEDVFVGPRAYYVLCDHKGEYDIALAAPMSADQSAYWEAQLVSGPHGLPCADLSVAA